MDRADVDTKIRSLIEPFNKKGVEISEETTFANDLEFDSLTVMVPVGPAPNCTEAAVVALLLST